MTATFKFAIEASSTTEFAGSPKLGSVGNTNLGIKLDSPSGTVPSIDLSCFALTVWWLQGGA